MTRLGPMSARAGLEWWGLGDTGGSHQDMAGTLTVPLGGALVRCGHRPLQGVNGCSVPCTKPGPGGSRAQPEQICRAVVLGPQSRSSAQQCHSRRGRGRVVWCRAHVVHLPRTQPSWDLPKGPGPSPPIPPPSGAPQEQPPHATLPPGPRHQVALPTKPHALTCYKALGRHQGTHTLLTTLPPVPGGTSRRTVRSERHRGGREQSPRTHPTAHLPWKGFKNQPKTTQGASLHPPAPPEADQSQVDTHDRPPGPLTWTHRHVAAVVWAPGIMAASPAVSLTVQAGPGRQREAILGVPLCN